MRVHPALLLVLIALTIPLVVEFRTIAVWLGVELTVGQTVGIGVLIVVALLAWAVFSDSNGSQNVRGE